MSTKRLEPEQKSVVSPISTMSPWKFDNISGASGSKREDRSPANSGYGLNHFTYQADTPMVSKFTASAHKEKQDPSSPTSILKVEKIHTAASNQQSQSPGTSGLSTPDLGGKLKNQPRLQFSPGS